MTVSTLQNIGTFLGNGSQSSFNFNFNNSTPFNSGTPLAGFSVIYTNASGVQTTLSPTTYSLSFTPALTGTLWGIGGTLTYPLSGSPIASGTSLTLQRTFSLQQLISISNQGNFSPENIEAMGDILEMQIQQLSARGGQYRGVWASGVVYNYGDTVIDGVNGDYTNNFYFCATANTSGVWNTDLANGDWVLVFNVAALSQIIGTYLPLGGGTITGNLVVDGSLKVGTTITGNVASVYNVIAYGADRTAATDSTIAIQSAINAAQTAGGGIVYFPPGEYLVSSTLTVNSASGYVVLMGAGMGISIIARNAAYGDTLDFNNGAIAFSCGVQGLTFFHDISLGHVMSGGHINANATLHFKIYDCNFQNGAYGVILAGGVYVDINNCHFQGQYNSGVPTKNSTAGLYLVATTNTGAVPIPTIINVTKCQFNGSTSGNPGNWEYCCVINACEELHFNACTFNGGYLANLFLQQLGSGVSANASILEVTCAECFFDSCEQFSVYISGSTGNGTNVISRVRFIGCGFNGELNTPAVAPGVGLQIDSTNRGGSFPQCLLDLIVSGCTFQAYYADAIVLNGNQLIVSNCDIYENNYSSGTSYAGGGTGSGITIGPAASQVTIVGGHSGGVLGVTSTQKYGVYITSGATNITISGVDVTGNATGAILDNSGSVTKFLTNNAGFNGNRASVVPTFPASTVNFTNPYGSSATVSIYNGTVTNTKLNGTTIATGTGTIFAVGANDILNITYSVLPSWIWWPQ